MNPPLMATHTGTEKVVNIGTSMFEQLADVGVRTLSPESARMFLQLSFNHSQQRRVDELSEKASQGTLTPDESYTLGRVHSHRESPRDPPDESSAGIETGRGIRSQPPCRFQVKSTRGCASGPTSGTKYDPKGIHSNRVVQTDDFP